MHTVQWSVEVGKSVYPFIFRSFCSMSNVTDADLGYYRLLLKNKKTKQIKKMCIKVKKKEEENIAT